MNYFLLLEFLKHIECTYILKRKWYKRGFLYYKVSENWELFGQQ